MKNASLPLRVLCDTAVAAAIDAGRYVQSVDRSAVQEQFKDAGTSKASQVVTEVDVRSEAIIRERLQPFSEQHDIAFVGEESAQFDASAVPERLLKSCFWCVDPLDGTLPFVEGRVGYAVSIALVDQAGNSLLGVVYDPVEETLWHAIRGQGAHRRGAIPPEDVGAGSSLMVFADRSFEAHESHADAVKALTACAQHSGLNGIEWVYGSGAVKNACQVLDHSNACYVKLPKNQNGGGSLWDYAATACIARESGGWASNIHGHPLELNRQGSTFMNHQGVIYASNEQIGRYLSDALVHPG